MCLGGVLHSDAELALFATTLLGECVHTRALECVEKTVERPVVRVAKHNTLSRHCNHRVVKTQRNDAIEVSELRLPAYVRRIEDSIGLLLYTATCESERWNRSLQLRIIISEHSHRKKTTCI